jgi:hypothetical protein
MRSARSALARVGVVANSGRRLAGFPLQPLLVRQIVCSGRTSIYRWKRPTMIRLGCFPTVVFSVLLLGGCSSPVAPSAPVTMSSSAPSIWRGLVIAEEDRCSPYDSRDYSYPQSLEDGIISRLGGLYSPYTGACFASRTEADIEHIVARSEAHDSGLCSADDATRRRFSQDPANLTLASPSLNRQKSDKDAAEWLPDRNACWFVSAVIDVRRNYSLTIDRLEADAIDRVLAACVSTGLEPSSCE